MPRSYHTAIDLVKLLDDGIAPVYVLDDDRRIVFCNDACARWTGLAVDELIDVKCVYRSPVESAGAPVESAAVAAGLCPPPKVFSGRQQTAVVACRRPDGRLVYRRGHFFPLDDGEDESAPVIAILDAHDCPGPSSETVDGAAAADGDEQLHDCVRRFRQQMVGRFGADSLIGNSPAIVRARAQVELASQLAASVLILGPSGTGKEHVARTIHYGQRASGPLVPLACDVLEPNSLRATLRALRLRHATMKQPAGTLLLEAADCLPSEAQAELAEMLREGALRLRLIATAVRSPLELAAERQFSQELACALSTMTIELPALSRRLEDLPLLAQAFLEEVNANNIKQLGGFSPEALDRLTAYPWPGNVDELVALVREAHERASSGEVAARDLPKRIQMAADAANFPPRADETIVIGEFLARVERELIARAMRRAKGNKSKAAKLLGLTRPRLYRRLVQLGLEQPDAKTD